MSDTLDLSKLSYAELNALLNNARKAQDDKREEARKAAQDAVELATQEVLKAQPVAASQKEGSSWVGSIMGGFEVKIDGRTYGVQISVKDVEASKDRAKALKSA